MMVLLLLASLVRITLFHQHQREILVYKQQIMNGSSMNCFCQICLFLVILMSDFTNGGMQGRLDNYNSLEDYLSSTVAPGLGPGYMDPRWLEPYFDPTTPRNVTALMGKSAYLSCRVRNLGNKTVSWIRHRDIHILTVGSYTYTSDQRFQATYHQDIDDWTLQIKWAQKRDAGMYECQISTQPVRSFFVRLNVVVPTATILGGPDLHVDKGSTINLTCTVRFSPEPPAYIFWYHHEEVINYDSSRGGVSVITEKGDVTTSFLLIQNADLADSGKYSCAPSNADVASVRVHVLNGEHPEAMQTGTSGCQYSWLTICLLLLFVFSYQHQQQEHISFKYSAVFSTATKTKPAHLNAHLLLMTKIIHEEQRQHQQKQITRKSTPTNLLGKPDKEIAFMLNKHRNKVVLLNKDTYLRVNDKEQLDTLQQLHEVQKIYKQTKILPPMLGLLIISVQDNDENKCIVISRGGKAVGLRRHLLSTQKTTKQQQQQKYVQIFTLNSTLFGSATSALVHLTTWSPVVLLLLLSYNKNLVKASAITTHSKLVVVHKYKATQICQSNITCNHK